MALSGAAMIALEWGIFVPLAVIFVTIRYTVRYLYPSKFASTGNWLVGISFTLFIVVPALDTVGWRNGFYNDKEALETPISGDNTAFGMKVSKFRTRNGSSLFSFPSKSYSLFRRSYTSTGSSSISLFGSQKVQSYPSIIKSFPRILGPTG